MRGKIERKGSKETYDKSKNKKRIRTGVEKS